MNLLKTYSEYLNFLISEKIFTNFGIGIAGGYAFYLLSFWTKPEVYSKPKSYLLGAAIGQALIIAILFLGYTLICFYFEKSLKNLKNKIQINRSE